MKCRILHESKGRLRVHMLQYRMTPEQADILQLYLQKVPGSGRVQVHERTMNAVICFDPACRDSVVRALAEFCYDDCPSEINQSGRQIRRDFEDRLFFMIAGRLGMRLLLPLPLRTVVTAVKAVPYIAKGLARLREGKVDVPVLDAASITVAMVHGDFETAGSVMFLLGVGELLEEWTHKKSVDDLAQRMMLNVDKVWLKSGGTEILADVDSVREGDIIVVRTGNVIPLDGVIESGEASINQASMTGESLPVHRERGGYAYAGTVIEEGEISICVKQTRGSGRYDKIVKMIEDSEKLKSATESRASHLADRLVPYSLGLTALAGLITGDIHKALAVLMVDYSCALKLAMPVSVLSGMRECSDHHIDVKGGRFLEAVADADTILFDKTGTLTFATPRVREVVTFGGRDEAEMLRLAACLEEHFPHSIANAVVEEAKRRGLDHEEKHAKVEYIVAHGIASSLDGERALIGSRHFIFDDEQCSVPEGGDELIGRLPEECSHLYMALGGELAAVICIEDPIREEARQVVEDLHGLGFDKVVMMTGDSERTAASVAERIGVDEYYAEVLPEEKAAFVRAEHEKGRKVIMIGDGINDSPALSEADAGIAIAAGAAIARDIADILISADDLRELITLRRISTALMERIRFNYRTIMGFNSALIALGLIGVLQPTTTALLHNASTIAIGMKSMTKLI
ncbi:MAG: heavy metal translocating P-type ATPase [Lachnospiraceae bacterium]|nr:heavy metal translocating P-type ATPase [Lachnospiraceae bacterium]